MDISPEATQRLNALMNERRLELRITWREVARRAGVSYEAIRAIRKGTYGVRQLTARKIDDALSWQGGSVEGIMNGTLDCPVELPGTESIRGKLRAIGDFIAGDGPEGGDGAQGDQQSGSESA